MTESEDKTLKLAAAANPELALKPSEPGQNWVKIAVDYGPIIAFGGTMLISNLLKIGLKTDRIIYASAALAIASIAALIVGLIAERRLAWIPLITAMLGIPFAVLTVVFKDPVFIKIKMTIIDVLIGGLLLGGLALKKAPLKALLGDTLKLRDEAWPRLTLYYALFYLAMAACNEAVWRTQSTDVWATWKIASMIGGPILFS
ncbi:MAG: inner membrane-spanning protein YciB, partial [Asticcacaulis sp.]